jgi:hypothetical protein
VESLRSIFLDKIDRIPFVLLHGAWHGGWCWNGVIDEIVKAEHTAEAPDKLVQLIFLNAFILPDGKCQFDLVPPEAAEGMTAAAQASPDNCVPVIEDFVLAMLMAGESAEKQDALIKRLVPQPFALFTTPVSTNDFDALRMPKSVMFCKDDVSLPPGAYLGMAQGLGKYDLVEVEGGHEALFTNPGVVAKAFCRHWYLRNNIFPI